MSGVEAPAARAVGRTRADAPGTERIPERIPERQAGPARPAVTRPPRTRRAHLRLTRLDPWSVMKISFMLAIAVAVVQVVAVVVLWSSLNAAHVFTQVNDIARNRSYFGTSGLTFDVLNYVGLNRVLGVSILLALVNAVLTTAIATLASFLYNLASGLLGGIEVTLAETD